MKKKQTNPNGRMEIFKRVMHERQAQAEDSSRLKESEERKEVMATKCNILVSHLDPFANRTLLGQVAKFELRFLII